LIGYDDTDLASLCTPTISTIHQPIKEMCQMAVEGIYQLSTSGTPVNNKILPVTLIKRQTT
jgi:LacI family sucrose operon transcriptional repressor